MTDAKLKVSRNGHVLEMALNRPEKYNAFDPELFHQLAAAYGELDSDAELRCGLVHGHGKNFTSGLELDKWAPIMASGKWPTLKDHERDPFGLNPQQRVRKPVVMAVHGICYTVAIELMLAADIRVAAADARFGQIEVKRGIYPVGGATVRMVQEFGWGNAQRWLLTGDVFDAAEAHRIGLVQEVVAEGEAYARGLALAQTVAKQAPLGVAASLKSSRRAVAAGEAEAMPQLLPELQPLMGSADVQEGVRSFLERREANFTGR